MNENTNYTGLRYITRGNTSPQGRPRVYFCSHDVDHERFLTSISDEILEFQRNVAIWYRNPDMEIDEDQHLADLSHMQLFVIPVTSRFLYEDNRARLVELSYAVEHHIPVLPLMQEPGLEEAFNERCGGLQFLDRHTMQNDPTAVPYEERLRRFLRTVLVSDEEVQRIRSAFRAYIFLSYRKKDRGYAQDIMRLIHRDACCRDVAIWYDEFLLPGERWSCAIDEALHRSSLFVLVVTPNLVQEANYVQTTEYPAAIALGKTVLPVEAIATNHALMAGAFKELPEITAMEDENAVHKRLEVTLPLQYAAPPENEDPEHLYLIGLAYLGGIDVEVDHERAVELITRAAQMDLPEACKRLVSMYLVGEGVARDEQAAIRWQERYVDHLRRRMYDQYSEEAAIAYCDAVRDLGQYYEETDSLERAQVTYYQIMAGAVALREHGAEDWQIVAALCLLQVGRMALQLAPFSDDESIHNTTFHAEEHYRRSVEILEGEIARRDTRKARQVLYYAYIQMGDLKKGDLLMEEAEEWYLKALHLMEELLQENTDDIPIRMNVGACYARMGDLCRAERRLGEAQQWLRKNLPIYEALAAETGTVAARLELSMAYASQGFISRDLGDLEAARFWFERSLELVRELAEETGSRHIQTSLALAYADLGDTYLVMQNNSRAGYVYDRSLAIIQKLRRTQDTPQLLAYEADAYMNMGNAWRSMGDLFLPKAMNWYQRCLSIRQRADVRWDDLHDQWKALQELGDTYEAMGETCQCMGDEVTAAVWYRKALDIAQRIYDRSHTATSLLALARISHLLWHVQKEDISLLEQASAYNDLLCERCPDDEDYCRNRERYRQLIAGHKGRNRIGEES